MSLPDPRPAPCPGSSPVPHPPGVRTGPSGLSLCLSLSLSLSLSVSVSLSLCLSLSLSLSQSPIKPFAPRDWAGPRAQPAGVGELVGRGPRLCGYGGPWVRPKPPGPASASCRSRRRGRGRGRRRGPRLSGHPRTSTRRASFSAVFVVRALQIAGGLMPGPGSAASESSES